jgi:hypothetical protein
MSGTQVPAIETQAVGVAPPATTPGAGARPSPTPSPAPTPAAATPPAGTPPATTEAPKPGAVLAPIENLLAGETKPADPAAADPNALKPADAPAALKAEDYKIPEALATAGYTAEDPTVKAYLTAAAELGVPQEQVSALMEKVAPEITKMLTQPHAAWKDLQKQWTDQVRADPVIGGDNLPATVATFNKGLAMFAAPAGATPDAVSAAIAEVKQALVVTGAGNHPAIIRLFHNAFSRLNEGTPVMGGGGGGAETKSAADILFNGAGNRKAATR